MNRVSCLADLAQVVGPLHELTKQLRISFLRIRETRVNKNGDVSIYNRAYHVGVRFQGQDVYVAFDPETNEWVFSDASGRELRHKPAREITPERVMALDVTVRR